MQRTGTKLTDKIHVQLGGVAFMPCKTVFGIEPVHLKAIAVTGHLGKDGCGCDGGRFRITADNGIGGNINSYTVLPSISAISGFP